MNELLGYGELETLIKNAADAELWEPDRRRLLFFRINDLRGKAPRMGNDELQLRADLQFLNSCAPREAIHPLLVWLQNSRPLVAGRHEQEFFEKLIGRLEGRPAQLGISATLIESVKNESILFQDDMLPIGYLQAGLTAARSVVRLRVPRYDNAIEQSKRYWGTGWLLTGSLLITNHHVLNARDDGEPDAAESDFSKQALHTTLQFDIDSVDGGSDPLNIVEIVASDQNLDYAIARMAAPQARPGLAVDWSPFALRPSEIVPLNIIQHPNGQPKKIAIRNNLATAAASPELRYFTSTLGGSSGAPVLNDKWQVVGIHRGSIGTKVLNFQGRNSAMVNLGTQMAAIFNSLPPAIKGELQ
jgi:V8-like Glu-specific endopeptidase